MTFYKLIAEHPLTPAGTLKVYEYCEKFQRVPLYCVYYTDKYTPAGCANVWRTGLTRKPSARQIARYVETLSY